MLKDKNILIGITGGISAYKICELIRKFTKAGANVKIVLTENAKKFVTPATLEVLSKNMVYTDLFREHEHSIRHIGLTDEADILVIAPASANTISKIASGICDNLLTSLICAFTKPIVFAPAMNTNMWNNPFIQKNINKLLDVGYFMVCPESGELACGTTGVGRMADIDRIFDRTKEALAEEIDLEGRKIVITAGGTKEEIDPVRYIGNHSSGKMGIALADAAHAMGADVTLISTVATQKPYIVELVKSAKEMLETTQSAMEYSDTLIMAAAVADYSPAKRSEHKIKKSKELLTIELIKNPDIVSEIAKTKQPYQTIIGFAAESDDVLENAKQKMKEKKLDFIVANDISDTEIGFGSEQNEVYVIDKKMDIVKIDRDTKPNVAKKILRTIFGGN